MSDLETRCRPDVASSPGPKACKFQLLGLETSIGSYPERKYVLADSLCLLENELILENNVIACPRIRYHKLCVLFLAVSLIGPIVTASWTYPEKTVDACHFSVCPVYRFVELIGTVVENVTPMTFTSL